VISEVDNNHFSSAMVSLPRSDRAGERVRLTNPTALLLLLKLLLLVHLVLLLLLMQVGLLFGLLWLREQLRLLPLR
jgi:hypothetical protein